ncbi:MAG: hypothetical protein M1833_006300 [Piccolia ochrophora]|nr:MAG: hypothetical protein M1833_006300 [Piccolia ochrophora]
MASPQNPNSKAIIIDDDEDTEIVSSHTLRSLDVKDSDLRDVPITSRTTHTGQGEIIGRWAPSGKTPSWPTCSTTRSATPDAVPRKDVKSSQKGGAATPICYSQTKSLRTNVAPRTNVPIRIQSTPPRGLGSKAPSDSDLFGLEEGTQPEYIAVDDYLSDGEFLQLTSGHPEREQEQRQPPASDNFSGPPSRSAKQNTDPQFEFAEVPSFWIDTIQLKKGVTVELESGDFLLLVSILEQVQPHEVRVRGWYLVRTKEVEGKLPRDRNELVWKLSVNKNDPRSDEDQSIHEFPISAVKRLRTLIMTNALFPAWSFRERMTDPNNVPDKTVLNEYELVCRWAYFRYFQNVNDQERDRPYEEALVRLRQGDPGTGHYIDDKRLRKRWREPARSDPSDSIKRSSHQPMEVSRPSTPVVLDSPSPPISRSPSPSIIAQKKKHSRSSACMERTEPHPSEASKINQIRTTGTLLDRQGSAASTAPLSERSVRTSWDRTQSIVDLDAGTTATSTYESFREHFSSRHASSFASTLSSPKRGRTSQPSSYPTPPSSGQTSSHYSNSKTSSEESVMNVSDSNNEPRSSNFRFQEHLCKESANHARSPSFQQDHGQAYHGSNLLHSNSRKASVFEIPSEEARSSRLSRKSIFGKRKGTGSNMQIQSSERAAKRLNVAPARSQGRVDLIRSKYTFGDCFCGAGGMSRAAKMSGLKIEWGFDKWEIAIMAWRQNFSGVAFHAPAHDFLSFKDDVRVDVMHLSPPCQTFSPAHTVDCAEDDHNEAAMFACRPLLEKARPRVATLEETAGLPQRWPHHFKALVQIFTSSGYSVRWSVINCAEYGLAQARKRLFMIASCPGERLPPFPSTTNSADVMRQAEENLAPLATVSDAIGNIPARCADHIVPAREISGKAYDSNLPLRGCITTSGGDNYHPSGRRHFSIRELACLQGFPLDHIFHTVAAKKQIGNAVPPVVGAVFLEEVRRALERADST